MLDICTLAFAYIVATTQLTTSCSALTSRILQKKPNHASIPTTTSTQLFGRPLTAMYERLDASVTSNDEVIRNIRVQEIDASLDILKMPVFGSCYKSDTNPNNPCGAPPRMVGLDRRRQYPIASMMQGSAGYIAEHAGSIVVFHLPEEQPDSVLRDIGLCYLLGLKIILVVSTDHSTTTTTASGGGGAKKSLRQVEETVGYLRTETERKLHRFLCMDQQAAPPSSTSSSSKRANVVSGNSFCTGQRFSPDAFAGKATQVSSYKIHQSLQHNDNIVVLTNVILDKAGDDWVCADGCQLAAKVAVELQASKLILFRNTPKLLTFGEAHVQDIPLSMAKAILENRMVVEPEEEEEPEENEAFWRELHWAAYAVDRGTSRAHLVNAPLDGALLEELFTAVNGANTCLYHDDELLVSTTTSTSSSVSLNHNNKHARAMVYSDFGGRGE